MKRENLCCLQTDFTLHLSIIYWYISTDYYQLSIDNNKLYNDDIRMDFSFKKQNEFFKNHFFSFSIIDNIQKIMLYYIAIHKSEGLDCSEGQDCIRNPALKSGQCTSCQFYFYTRNNYR